MLKLKVEKEFDDNITDYFLSFNKSGILRKYSSSEEMNYSYVLMSYDKTYMDQDEIHLEEIFIQETKRGTGLGKIFMLRAIEYAKTLNKKTIRLRPYSKWCNTPIEKLNHFYESFGFQYEDSNDEMTLHM